MSSAANPNYTDDLAAVSMDRLRSLWLQAFAHLSRKPQHVYDVQAGKRPALFCRHRGELWRLYQLTGDADAVLAYLDELRADVEQWRGIDEATADIRVALRAEVAAECGANTLQLVATQTDDEADLERAYEAGMVEESRTRVLNRSFARRLAEKRQLRRVARRRLGIGGKA